MAIKTLKEIFAPVWWDNFKGIIDDNFNFLLTMGNALTINKAENVNLLRLQSATQKVLTQYFPDDVSDAALNTVITSSDYFYWDFDPSNDATIEIADGEYQLNGGDWSSTSSTLLTTDVLKFRGTSSAVAETAVEVTVTITVGTNPVDLVWTITTAA